MIEQTKLEAAAEAIDAEAGICAEWTDLVQTLDTIADFIATHGQPRFTSTADNGCVVHEWPQGRRTLAVVDCGEGRAALCM
jgi:hypothetical protein